MFVYIPTKTMWEVGFFGPYSEWLCVHRFPTEERAASFVNFLNGGDGKFIPRGQIDADEGLGITS